MKKTKCEKCGNEFSNKGGNYNKHINSCDGKYIPFVKLSSCKYCYLSFGELSNHERANHSRWCNLNPKKKDYLQTLCDNRSNRIGRPLSEEHKKKLSDAHKSGKYSHVDYRTFLGKKHTDESRALMSLKARSSTHRRLVRTIRPYNRKDGSIVMLDSSWEEALAVRLDELNIDWIRPEKPIPYVTTDGKTHNYFPDFYLPKYNLYLDPKNPGAFIAQKNKIDILNKMLPNLMIIKSLDECKNFKI